MFVVWLALGCEGVGDKGPSADPSYDDPSVFLSVLAEGFCENWVPCQDTIPTQYDPVLFDSVEDCTSFITVSLTETTFECSYDATSAADCIDAQRAQSDCYEVGQSLPACASVYSGKDCKWFHLSGTF